MTQFRLESYLASSSPIDLDLTHNLDQNNSYRQPTHTSGASTPKDLTSRLKILELFTLHVLPRNDEWDYARSFISMSDMLDDERREAFLQSLQELQDVKEQEMYEEAAILQQEKDAELQERLLDRNRIEAGNAAAQGRALGRKASVHRRTSSEVDYGIEKQRPNGTVTPATNTPKPAPTSKEALSASPKTPHSGPSTKPSNNRNMRKSPQRRPPAYIQQVTNLIRGVQSLVRHITTSIGANPTILLKMLLSVVAIIMALSRRDIRDRAQRILRSGWDKVRNTVGMGVKVSYI
jgi:hypothetical protein